MAYDLAKGRPAKLDVEWDPSQRLDTAFRIARATRIGSVAGWVICGDYLVTALITWRQLPRPHALLSHDPATLAAIQGGLALAAGALALLMRTRPGVWPASILLAWAGCEVIRFIPAKLYAHGAPTILAGLMLMLAILGFRGALALRKPPPAA
jgi:hypothetical protein